MSIFGDLMDLASMCDHGRAEIVNKEVRFERNRNNTTVECTVVLEQTRGGNRESAGFMMRLLRAHEDSVARVEQIRTHYDGRDNIQREVRFFTDQSTYEWIDSDNGRIQRVGRDRLGRSTTRTFREFQREVLGQVREERARDDRADAAAYAYRSLGLAGEEIVRREIVQAYNAASPALSSEGQETVDRLRQQYNVSISVDPAMSPDQVRIGTITAEYGQTLNVPKIKASKDYGNKIIACRIGDPNSHTWVDVPAEGPTARRCSECKRVTGEFWKPDDYKRFIEWLVTNTKILVVLWARDLDATELRFSLLETDSNRKTAEETTDDDAVIRFGLLDMK
jgi:hypothetical protein